VIGVAVREEDRIDAIDLVRERLRAQIRARVDEQPKVIVGLDENRRTHSPVARIVRLARGTVAADHRHAARGASAEESDLQGSMIRLSSC
jgi:hypothetical protein